jgi:hypothetical protein
MQGREGGREGSASFLKKRSKKLLLNWAPGVSTNTVQCSESFLVTFFQKSNFFLNLPFKTPPLSAMVRAA